MDLTTISLHGSSEISRVGTLMPSMLLILRIRLMDV
jgi:hypothetical protein